MLCLSIDKMTSIFYIFQNNNDLCAQQVAHEELRNKIVLKNNLI